MLSAYLHIIFIYIKVIIAIESGKNAIWMQAIALH